MSATQKLALKIGIWTLIGLAGGTAVVCGVLIARAPANRSPEIFLQLGHSRSVNSVAWSPDGKSLATGSDDDTVKLWAAGGGQLPRNLSGHTNSVSSMAWSPDGKTLV